MVAEQLIAGNNDAITTSLMAGCNRVYRRPHQVLLVARQKDTPSPWHLGRFECLFRGDTSTYHIKQKAAQQPTFHPPPNLTLLLWLGQKKQNNLPNQRLKTDVPAALLLQLRLSYKQYLPSYKQ